MPEADRFRTPVPLPQTAQRFSYATPFLCMGSCFAEHIGDRLASRRFDCLTNPFGILYNPSSLARAIQRIHEGAGSQPEDLVHRDGLWHSWDHHGRFSHPEREEAVRRINRTLQTAHAQLKRAPWLLLSFGTAWVYRLKDTGRIVANNHKFPASAFEKDRLSVSQTVDALSEAVRLLPSGSRIWITVSPVRHLRDGLVDNQHSKATLLLAAHELCRQFDRVQYFPAYELVLDELRDYRFFEADMVHPNALAVDYVWEQFIRVCLAPEARSLMQALEHILKAARHRPLHPDTEAHRQFCQTQLQQVKELQKSHPFLKIDDLRETFENQIET